MSTDYELPTILKNFLSDVYECDFPDSMQQKIALETKNALNVVLLDNISFFEDLQRGSSSQAPDSVPQQQIAPVVTNEVDDRYVQQQHSGQQQHTQPKEAPARQSRYRGSTKSSIVFGGGQPEVSPSRRRGAGRSTRSTIVFGNEANDDRFNGRRTVDKASRPAVASAGRRRSKGHSSTFSLSDGSNTDSFSGSGRRAENAQSRDNTRETRNQKTPSRADYEQQFGQSRQQYTESRRRNQTSNIFG